MRLRNRSGEYDPRFLLDNLNQGNFLKYKKKIYEQLTIIIFLLNKVIEFLQVLNPQEKEILPYLLFYFTLFYQLCSSFGTLI